MPVLGLLEEKLIIFKENKKYCEAEISLEKDLENDVVKNSKLFFGKDSIYIDAKKKLDSKNLGGVIPDGFLFNFADKENPEFYIVEVELSKHDFYGHIFPQFTKFFGFFKVSKTKEDLADKLYNIITNDSVLKKEFKKFLGENEIYKFIKDLLDESQNILLVIDGEKNELPDVMETYTDTWGQFVKIIILQKFVNDNEVIYSMNPEFENIDYSYINKEDEKNPLNTVYTEEGLIGKINEDIKKIYFEIKNNLLEYRDSIIFNPKKYYISIINEKNIAFFTFNKSKIHLIVKMDENLVKEKIINHEVKHLSESVQKFWNGTSCEIEITNNNNLEEIINLLKELISSAAN